MTYHARHLGSALDAARLLIRGWRLLADYEPISPVIDGAWWLRCPSSCCPREDDPCAAAR